MTGAGRHATGFSLIEMLVSLAVCAVIAQILLLGLQRVGGDLDRIRHHDQGIEDVVAAQQLLRTRIERIATEPDPDNIAYLDLAGGDGTIEFISDPLASAAPDALQRYRLAVDDGGALMLYHRSALALAGADGARWLPLRLLGGVDRIAVRYYGSVDGSAAAIWQDSWRRRKALPLAVAIHLDFAAKDRRQWPDLVVRPRAATVDTCWRDPATGQCQRRL